MDNPCWWWAIITFLTTVFICLFLKLCIKENQEKKKRLDNDYPKTPMPENHRLSYQSGNTYLQELKNSQWHITYLCALVFGAIIAITQLKISSNEMLLEDHRNLKYLLQLISLVVLFTNIYLITERQFIIMRSRISIMKHKELFDFDHYWMTDDERKEEREKKPKFFYNNPILFIFFLPNVAGCFFVHYLLFLA